MKKHLFLLVITVLAIVGCQKEVATGVQGGDQTVTFSVVADNEATKAGEVTAIPSTINKCVAVVRMYDAYDQLLSNIYAQPTCTKDGESYKFSVDLMGGQKYEVTVLLYTDGVYTVDSKLEAIERVDKTARNNANLDMFSASITYSAGETTPLIIAKRPFAQLNLKTIDLVENFEPSIKVKYTAPQYFNAVTGEVSGSYNYETTGTYEYAYAPNQCTLSSDYIFASDEKSLLSVEMTATKTGAFVRTFDNLPLQRNYKTNVIGKLLTVDAPFTVQVNADWYTPDTDIHWQNAENIAAANALLAAAAAGQDVNINVNVPDDAATVPVKFTPANSGSDIALTFGDHSAGTPLTIKFTKDAVATVNPASVTVEAPAGTTLVFETETHVVINGTNYGVISGTFSANTLVINKGVSVEKVIMTAGGLEVHGTLGAFEAAASHGEIIVRDCEGLSESVYNALKSYIDHRYYTIENETSPKTYDIALNSVAELNGVSYATLAEAIAAANAGDEIVLKKDMELSSAIEIAKNLTLNLNGKTITNNVASNRLFRLGDATFTIDGTTEGSSMIIPETNKYSFGFVDMRNNAGSASTNAKLVLNGGYYEGATLGGAFFKGRNHYQTFELIDVHCKCTSGDGKQYYANGYYYNGDNASVVNAHGYLTNLKIDGGLYEYASLAKTASNVFQGYNFMTGDVPSVSFDGVKIVSNCGPIYELSYGKMTVNDCDFTIEGAETWQNSALCASNNAVLNVNGTKFNAPYSVYALTSGAEININDGEFIGSKSLLVAGTDSYYPTAVSTINVYGGTFTYTGSTPSDAIKVYGDRPANVNIYGGTFNVDPTNYVAEGYDVNEQGGNYVVELSDELKPLIEFDITEYVKVSKGFFQNKATYSASTDFYITTVDGLRFFADIINDGTTNGVADTYAHNFNNNQTAQAFFQSNVFTSKTVHLLADVDLNNELWTPIGWTVLTNETGSKVMYDKQCFYGSFNGHNKTIKNLKTVESVTPDKATRHYSGLFGYYKATYGTTFQNVILENVDIKGYYNGAALVGGGTATNFNVSNCHVKGLVKINMSRWFAGGIVGLITANIQGCSVKGDDGSSIEAGYCSLGAIASVLRANSTINNCEVENITLKSGQFKESGWGDGGVLGYVAEGATNVTISNNTIKKVTINSGSRTDAVGSILGSAVAINEGKTLSVVDNTVIDCVVTANGETVTNQVGSARAASPGEITIR